MKKTILTIFSVLLLVVSAQAQVFNAGAKGGVGGANVTIRDAVNNPADYATRSAITSYHIGVFSRINILGFHIQPEAILTRTGGDLSVTPTLGANVPRVEQVRFNRFDVPVMLGLNLVNTVRIQAGPMFSVPLTAEQGSRDIKDFMRTSDWGLQAGLGVDIQRVTLDLRYENLRNKYEDANQQRYTIANQQLLLSIGYKFF